MLADMFRFHKKAHLHTGHDFPSRLANHAFKQTYGHCQLSDNTLFTSITHLTEDMGAARSYHELKVEDIKHDGVPMSNESLRKLAFA